MLCRYKHLKKYLANYVAKKRNLRFNSVLLENLAPGRVYCVKNNLNNLLFFLYSNILIGLNEFYI